MKGRITASVLLVVSLALAASCGGKNIIKTPLLDSDGKPVETSTGQPVYVEKTLSDEAYNYDAQTRMQENHYKQPFIKLSNNSDKPIELPVGFCLEVNLPYGFGGGGGLARYRPWYADYAPQLFSAGLAAFTVWSYGTTFASIADNIGSRYYGSFNADNGSLARFSTYGNVGGGTFTNTAGWNQDNRVEQNPVITNTTGK